MARLLTANIDVPIIHSSPQDNRTAGGSGDEMEQTRAQQACPDFVGVRATSAKALGLRYEASQEDAYQQSLEAIPTESDRSAAESRMALNVDDYAEWLACRGQCHGAAFKDLPYFDADEFDASEHHTSMLQAIANDAGQRGVVRVYAMDEIVRRYLAANEQSIRILEDVIYQERQE